MIRRICLIGLLFLQFALEVQAQPSFTSGGDVTVNQNSGPAVITNWATNIVATTPSFQITNIGFSGFLSFAAGGDPVVDASGTLTFTPAADKSGVATITVLLKDLSNGQQSIATSFKVNVTFINSAPTFSVPSADQTVDEKAGMQTINNWAMSISAGPNPEEFTQKLTFTTEIMSQSAFMSFVSPPKVDKFGTLSYEATNQANGSANIRVYLEDDGSNTSPNANRSTNVDFVITINPINDAPVFNKGINVEVDEHAGLVSLPNWATNISAGAPDEETQNLTFVITENTIGPYLQYDIPVSVDANGTLSFQATPHYNGVAVYEIFLQDDGPGTLPNVNKSLTQAFTVSVDFINDAPTFDIGPDQVVDEGDVIYTIPNWATNISPGQSPNEQDQKLLFTINFQQVTGTLAFLQAPELDLNGQLTFRPTEHTHGEAIFNVTLTDDGAFDPPNSNVSETKTFKITVNPVNFPPDDIKLTSTSVLEKQPVGTFVGRISATDLDPEDTHTFALVAGEGSDDNASFSIDSDNNLITAEMFDFKVKNSYSIRLITSDGEFSLDKKFIISIEKLIDGVKFANAFTPNGDGENDTWEIEDIEAFPDATIFIYDRSGRSVFSSQGGYSPWDGTFKGKVLPMGNYYYIIDLKDGSDIYKGTLTIIL